MKRKKGVQLTLQVIIVIVLLLIVAAVLIFIFQKRAAQGSNILEGQENAVARCAANPAECEYVVIGDDDDTPETSEETPPTENG